MPERYEASSAWLTAAATLAAAATGLIIARTMSKPRYTFRNKAVLITGGSRGLGLEIARVFAREGAYVSLLARNSSTLEEARRELDQIGHRVLVIPCDIRSQEQVIRAVKQTVDTFGRLDVVVNNAGVIQVGPFESMTLEDYQRAMETHAWGTLYTSLSAIPHMRRRRGGRIVNIVSIGGKVGVPHLLPYVMSKFAQAGLSEALGNELSREGIFVTTVYPGLMRTGSHVNALFKGDHEKEFAWFSIGAGMPVISINAQRAAQQIVDASREGLEELVITPAARAAAMGKGVSPRLIARSMRLMNAFLPRGGQEPDRNSRSGWESRSSWSPSTLTKLADSAIERNNEHRAVG